MQLRRARPLAVLVAVLGVVAAACTQGDTSVQSITDPDLHTKIEVPVDWEIYTNDALGDLTVTPFVVQPPGVEMPVISRFVFDAAPTPTTENLLAPTSQIDFPVGSSVVRRIAPDLRDFMSRYLLAEVVVPYHAASASQELLKQDIDFGADYEGVQLMVVYRDVTEADAGVMMISVTDPEVTTLYQVAVGCSLECFDTYTETIAQVVDSWLVNTRG